MQDQYDDALGKNSEVCHTVSSYSYSTIMVSQAEVVFVSKNNIVLFSCPCLLFNDVKWCMQTLIGVQQTEFFVIWFFMWQSNLSLLCAEYAFYLILWCSQSMAPYCIHWLQNASQLFYTIWHNHQFFWGVICNPSRQLFFLGQTLKYVWKMFIFFYKAYWSCFC